MAKRASITNFEAMAMFFAPVCISVVAVLIQIREGKGYMDTETAIKEARKVIQLAIQTEPGSVGKKA